MTSRSSPLRTLQVTGLWVSKSSIDRNVENVEWLEHRVSGFEAGDTAQLRPRGCRFPNIILSNVDFI